MRTITSQRPSVYRRSSYGALGVIGLVVATVIGMMLGLGIISLDDLPRIIENLWTGSSGTGSGRI